MHISVIFLSVAATIADHAGVTLRHDTDPARGNRPITSLVWYPTDAAAGEVERANGDGLFVPVRAVPDAPLAAGAAKLPLVVMSHGDQGNKQNEEWLAVALAKHGYVVAAVDHYGNTSADKPAIAASLNVWERPKDLSVLIDRVLADPALGARIDPSRIYAIGHSAGGATVTLLAGGRMRHDRLGSPLLGCDKTNPFAYEWCSQLLAYDYKQLPKESIEADHADPRVKKVLALDPGFYAWFAPESLTALQGKAAVVIAGTDFYPGVGLRAEKFADHFGNAATLTLPANQHFDFLADCAPKAKAEGKVPLCRGGDRTLAHERTLAFALEWFSK